MSTDRAPADAGRWKPGDPDRRKAEPSLLELTGTPREEHHPEAHPIRKRAQRAVPPADES